jgi:hypothetical protein
MKSIKRLFAGALACLFAASAFGTTLNSIQLLNPIGSTTGQTIISTGASTAPAWGGVPLNGIASIAANSVIGNATNASASPTAVTVTGCNGAAQALQWTNGSGFGCNSSIATSGANANITSLNGPALGAATATTLGVIDPSTSNTQSLKLTAVSDTNGANFLMTGNGATTPSKIINVFNGVFRIMNNAYSTAIMSMDDSGNVTYTGLVSAPTLKATGFARLQYTNASSQSIPALTLTTITTWTSVNDDNSNFTASTGTFTAPNTGWYLISGQITFNVATGALSNQFQILVVANAVTVGTFTTVLDAAANQIAVPFSIAVKMTAAQTAILRAFQTSSGAQTLNSGATANVLSIVELP